MLAIQLWEQYGKLDVVLHGCCAASQSVSVLGGIAAAPAAVRGRRRRRVRICIVEREGVVVIRVLSVEKVFGVI